MRHAVGLVGGAAVLTWGSGYIGYRLGQDGMIGVEGSAEAAPEQLGLQPTVDDRAAGRLGAGRAEAQYCPE